MKERLGGLEHCWVTGERTPEVLSVLLEKAVHCDGCTESRQRIVEDGLENASVAEKLMTVYRKIIGV